MPQILPYIPQRITVHLGPPDADAPNVTVSFPDYVKNVASSEIYPTWEESALRANILAIVSFALNRVYTEFYRSRGYDFDITNSTAYDQFFVNGRSYFENVARLADELYSSYLRRPGFVEPLAAKFCNGTTVTCEGLSQWGSQNLALQGYTTPEILRSYYGDVEIVSNAPVQGITSSYPGVLRRGYSGPSVVILQVMLNRISQNYPAIPKIYPVNGVFDANTESAVKAFQEIFNLTPDGIVGPATWYQITSVYNAVLRLAELNAIGITLQDISRTLPEDLREGMRGDPVRLLQFFLSTVGRFHNNIPPVTIDGIFGTDTRTAVQAFQRSAGLTPDGIVGSFTWNNLIRAYETIRASQKLSSDVFPPTNTLVLGSRSADVTRLQNWLNRLSEVYPQIEPVPATGFYGELTRNAVLTFQQLYGLTPTGNVNPYTFYVIGNAAEQVENQ